MLNDDCEWLNGQRWWWWTISLWIVYGDVHPTLPLPIDYTGDTRNMPSVYNAGWWKGQSNLIVHGKTCAKHVLKKHFDHKHWLVVMRHPNTSQSTIPNIVKNQSRLEPQISYWPVRDCSQWRANRDTWMLSISTVSQPVAIVNITRSTGRIQLQPFWMLPGGVPQL